MRVHKYILPHLSFLPILIFKTRRLMPEEIHVRFQHSKKSPQNSLVTRHILLLSAPTVRVVQTVLHQLLLPVNGAVRKPHNHSILRPPAHLHMCCVNSEHLAIQFNQQTSAPLQLWCVSVEHDRIWILIVHLLYMSKNILLCDDTKQSPKQTYLIQGCSCCDDDKVAIPYVLECKTRFFSLTI